MPVSGTVMATFTGMDDLDPVRWPHSLWRSLKVGWDESTTGERQRRLSLWEIEPLTATFRLWPPTPGFSIQTSEGRNRGRGDEEMDLMLKKSSFWSREDGSDALGALNFPYLGMDSWMRNQTQLQQPGLSAQQNEYQRALAAAALQEFRGADTSKHSMAHAQPSVSPSQMQFRSQSPQTNQHGGQQLSSVSGPMLQLSSSRPRSPLEVAGVNMAQCSGYSEGDIHMGSSPSASGSFPLHSMLGRTHLGCESGQLAHMIRPTHNAQQSQSVSLLHGGSSIVREPQV